MLYELLYTSTSARDMDEYALLDLLIESRDNNVRLGVTGLLVYQQQSFIQLLEGEKEQVLDVYSSICADSRHTGVTTVFEEGIEFRCFADWSMAYLLREDDPLERLLGEGIVSEGFVAKRIANNPSTARALLMAYNVRVNED